MTSREMLITFEELVRAIDPKLEFDPNMNTDVVYMFLTKAEKQYIVENFLMGDNMTENINLIRKRSDVLRKIIKRCGITSITSANQLDDGGYEATFDASDYWMFLSGVLKHDDLPTTNRGSSITAVNLELLNHYDIEKKIRTINNEPVVKQVPIVLEGDDKFVFYLGKEYEDVIGGVDIANVSFNIIYLAYPSAIDESTDCELAESTHYDIVELAAKSFVKEYKYLLNTGQIKQNN